MRRKIELNIIIKKKKKKEAQLEEKNEVVEDCSKI